MKAKRQTKAPSISAMLLDGIGGHVTRARGQEQPVSTATLRGDVSPLQPMRSIAVFALFGYRPVTR
jgi:hypothetical protein